MSELRIVSFLPAATEMVCALGLEDELVGVTHECDYPPGVKSKPIVVRATLPVESMSLGEIDAAVGQCIRNGRSLYEVDEALLRDLAPTHILTQSLCDVCAPSGNEITRALAGLPVKPRVVWLTPRSLADIEANVRELGEVTGRQRQATQLIETGRKRLETVAAATRIASHRPRVFCLEWTDPYYCSGHWVPEMVEIAWGTDALGRVRTDSIRVEWRDIEQWSPEILIVMPCGFGVERAAAQAKLLIQQPGWRELPAVRDQRVYAVDANSYFARPGPRIVDGTELLAHIIHPDLIPWSGRSDAFRRIPSAAWQPRTQTKRCPQCGVGFSCGALTASQTCWCHQLPRVMPLKTPHGDCLCPDCLRKAIQQRLLTLDA